MTEPKGPTGVWAEYADGVIYQDLPTVYMGQDEEDCAMFEVIVPRDADMEHPVAIGAERWPGKTGLSVPIPDPRPETREL